MLKKEEMVNIFIFMNIYVWHIYVWQTGLLAMDRTDKRYCQNLATI